MRKYVCVFYIEILNFWGKVSVVLFLYYLSIHLIQIGERLNWWFLKLIIWDSSCSICSKYSFLPPTKQYPYNSSFCHCFDHIRFVVLTCSGISNPLLLISPCQQPLSFLFHLRLASQLLLLLSSCPPAPPAFSLCNTACIPTGCAMWNVQETPLAHT